MKQATATIISGEPALVAGCMATQLRAGALIKRNLPQVATDAFHGIAGEFVRRVIPHTEADLAAVLIQFLIAVGVYVGRTGFFQIEGDKHYTNLNAVIVGNTSKGRKGTSWGQVKRLMCLVDPAFVERNITSGISSGEGIIWAVRDEISEDQPIKGKGGRVSEYQRVKIDAGVQDKRLLVQESEFARVLKNTHRDNNNASAVIREAWDSGTLNILTKNNRTQATKAHIGIIGHITANELNRLLTTTEAANGFANRFLWIYATRSKILPFGGELTDADLTDIAQLIRQIRSNAERMERIRFDPEAAEVWQRVYGPLSEGKPGLLGAVTGRAEAQVLRLSTLYALLDGQAMIRREHLRAALAIWDYAAESARLIFGEALGNDTADIILSYVRTAGPSGVTRTDINSRLFKRNKEAHEIDRALHLLKTAGLAHTVRVMGQAGAPTQLWFARRGKESSDEINEVDEVTDKADGISSFNSSIW